MRIYSCAITNLGKVRKNNEDAYLCDDAAGLYAVADGMGGHAAGEVASRIAIETLRAHSAHIDAAFAGALVYRAAHEAILANMRMHPERDGMGTTLVSLRVLSEDGRAKSVICHAGDSRCYLIRNGIGCQITPDHADRNGRLLNCLGVTPDSFRGAETNATDLRVGDTLILCSDGLSDYVSAGDAAASVAGASCLRFRVGAYPSRVTCLADALVTHALNAGGHDNITVIVLEVAE